MSFTEDEFDSEETNHNKPLHIIVRCKEYIIAKVPIDNGSALNVLPRYILNKIPVDISHMKPNTMTTRAYDGSPRQVIINIKIELVIGPQPFQVTF